MVTVKPEKVENRRLPFESKYKPSTTTTGGGGALLRRQLRFFLATSFVSRWLGKQQATLSIGKIPIK
jgi:hypothetical protein